MLLYPLISNLTGSFNSASCFNKTDYTLFVKGNESDFWYGISNNDSIELSVYDLNENLIYWSSKQNNGKYKKCNLTYYDSKNNPIYYVYDQFIFDKPLYKTEKILVDPLLDLSSSNVPSGNYKISYNFTRYLAGNPNNPLVIKEVSSNKTELKIISIHSSSVDFNSFCIGKVVLNDLSSLYLSLTKNCPYSILFENSKTENKTQIDLIKNLFFIPNDGKFVEFLKSIYEDDIKYSTKLDSSSVYTRVQGIKTYFSNFLVSNGSNSYSFDEIKFQFSDFVNSRLNILFLNFKSTQYISAKEYLYKLFVDDFFSVIHNFLKNKYQEKYRNPLKNVLSYGMGQYIPILSTSFIDERKNGNDSLTLLVKLQYPINDDISIKSNVWISNAGMVPIFFNCVIKENYSEKIIKISGPDFTVIPNFVSITNSNKYYNHQSLENLNDDLITVSKKINELNIDYTNFENFVVFSSIGLRHNIFKNKMLSLSNIDTSLFNLESDYSSSGYSYPYYTTEKESLQTEKSNVLNSFDGWESYLYKTGYYQYLTSSGVFFSQSFVDNMDFITNQYDRINKDSLVNNTPEYIVYEKDNDDYLIFLSMIGHFFDNLYLYIKSIPSENSLNNSKSFSKNILQQMLQSFGWNLDTSLDKEDISNNYLDLDLNGINEISSNDRTRQIWNRILNTLPQIYKTKGTEECIKMVLSCCGIPSTMVSIKEFGGINFSNSEKTSYTIEEKLYMLTFDGKSEYILIPFYPTNRTVEFKVSLNPNHDYKVLERIPLAVKYNANNELNWSVGVYKERGENLGRAYFEITTGSSVLITSSLIPIFNGEIFNIMLRKNDPVSSFEYTPITDLVPSKFDLKIQRREDGRDIFSSYSSYNFTQSFNLAYEDTGLLYFGNFQYSDKFYGMLDKILLWDVPISDSTFNDHCNNINSYSYTGSSVSHEVLYFRMNFDYPKDLSSTNPYTIVNSNEYYSSSIFAVANNFGVQSYSASIDNCIAVSHSVFPYQFTEIPYNQTFTISSYGPNKYKNIKTEQIDLPLVARLDPNERSSYSPNIFLTPDSNQIGLFADPNFYKNKDIFRYFGDCNLTSLLADPKQMFDDKYYPLKNTRQTYNDSGNKRVLYTEMFTLYRFYFDKSIFEIIKQLIPARNNILTGILIEPTALERPKYQHKKINTEIGISYTSSAVPQPITSSTNPYVSTLISGDTIQSIKQISGEFISVDFNLSKDIFSSQLYEHVPFFLSEGPYSQNDNVYNEYLSLKNKLVFCVDGWIKKYPSVGELNKIEYHSDWPIPATDYGPTGPTFKPGETIFNTVFNGNLKYSGVVPGFYPTSSGYYYLKNCYFYVKTNEYVSKNIDNLNKNIGAYIDFKNITLPTLNYNLVYKGGVINDIDNYEELGSFCDDNGKIIETLFSGESFRYLLKKWIKDSTYVLTGEYSKPQTVQSHSLYFYTTEAWKDQNYNNLIKQQPLLISDVFYETTSGYPRNHLTHKKIFLSNESKAVMTALHSVILKNGVENTSSFISFERYVRSRQTIDTTLDETGLNDFSLPVQSINVSNINVVKTSNVLN